MPKFEIPPQPNEDSKRLSGKLAGKRGESFVEITDESDQPAHSRSEKTSLEDAKKRIRHVIADWANTIAGFAYFDNDLPGFKHYIEENPPLRINEKYEAEFTKSDLSQFPDLREQVEKIDNATQNLMAASSTEEFKRRVNEIFFLIYPDRGPNSMYNGEDTEIQKN